jgi:glycosyltransferase involved in cell wall biosynthesis
MHKKKLAIISTHPIQYYAPVFRALQVSPEVQPKVFYTWSQSAQGRFYDAGFGAELSWDIPLLDGYEYEFVPNVARRPGIHHFLGTDNPALPGSVERWGADAVLVYAWNLRSHLQALRHFKGRTPVLFRGDSTLLDRRSATKTAARRAFLRWVYRHIDVALAVGRNNRDYFEWCGVPKDRITFAPHSVDTARFADPTGVHADQAAAWRRQLGIAADEQVIAFAGKLIPKKDPGLLLEAFLQLGIAARLVFFGSGELEPALRARARGHANVHFLPFQNQSVMPAVYRLADVFVLPSKGPGETWGLALNEAMASGRAVIAGTQVGGARDLVNTGVNGWVFESGRIDSLVQVLRQALLAGRESLLRMGAAGNQMIQGWSTEAAAQRIAAAVTRLTA